MCYLSSWPWLWLPTGATEIACRGTPPRRPTQSMRALTGPEGLVGTGQPGAGILPPWRTPTPAVVHAGTRGECVVGLYTHVCVCRLVARSLATSSTRAPVLLPREGGRGSDRSATNIALGGVSTGPGIARAPGIDRAPVIDRAQVIDRAVRDTGPTGRVNPIPLLFPLTDTVTEATGTPLLVLPGSVDGLPRRPVDERRVRMDSGRWPVSPHAR